MRTLWMITTALVTAATVTISVQDGYAQDAGAAHTMDAQLEQLKATGQYDASRNVPSSAAPAEQIANQPITADGVQTGNGQVMYQSMIESQGSGAIPPLPLDVQTNGQVTYINGGISDEEVDMLKARASEFNTHIQLASTGGHYMVASKFHILDGTGLEVLSVDDAGPYVYAKLSPGKYTVEATENGEIKTATINVPASGSARVQLLFKQ